MKQVKIFVSYAHEDQPWVEEGTPQGLMPWLQNQLRRDHVDFWWDHGIHVGDDWERMIFEKIDEAQIVILLLSDDFAGSDYIMDHELPRIRERYLKGQLTVLPILISSISRRTRDRLTWVVGIQMLPNDKKGLNMLLGGHAWTEIRSEILDEIYHRACLLRTVDGPLAEKQEPPLLPARETKEVEAAKVAEEQAAAEAVRIAEERAAAEAAEAMRIADGRTAAEAVRIAKEKASAEAAEAVRISEERAAAEAARAVRIAQESAWAATPGGEAAEHEETVEPVVASAGDETVQETGEEPEDGVVAHPKKGRLAVIRIIVALLLEDGMATIRKKGVLKVTGMVAVVLWAIWVIATIWDSGSSTTPQDTAMLVRKGMDFQNGTNGVAKDQVEAVKWLRKAAELGNSTGQNNLGACYFGAIGVSKNSEEAVKWFKKAAELGHSNGQLNLGYCYQHGDGVSKDPVEAAKWYRKAAAQGNENAKKRLRELGK